MSHERCKCCQELYEVIHGKPNDPKTGLFYIATSSADLLVGTDRNPGGLFKTVAEHEQLKWKILGGAFAIGVLFTIINGLLSFGPTLIRMLSK
jgi:hypothetical protein